MPLPDHVVPVAMGTQYLGEGPSVWTDFSSVTRVTTVEIGEASNSDGVMIATR